MLLRFIKNAGKFQAITFDKRKGNYTNQIINNNQKQTRAKYKLNLEKTSLETMVQKMEYLTLPHKNFR